MKILLLGEYSGFFNSLKDGLNYLNHEVLLVGKNDSFKDYPLDISFEAKFLKKACFRFLRQGVSKILNFDIAVLEIFLKFLKNKSKLKDFDIVFLINEQPITKIYFFEKLILNFIFRNNEKVYLSACGDDFVFVNFLLKNKIEYHPLTPYFANTSLKKDFKYMLHYTKAKSKRIHKLVLDHIEAIIPADLDYVQAYESHPKVSPLIPFPVRINLLEYIKPSIDNKIIIFHGINKSNYLKKGNDIFESALRLIRKKYASKLEIITTMSLPYSEYIKKYNKAHIVLDQVYSYDQGYNALEAMAKGKVVFTGAEKIWRKHYKLEEDTVAVNAEPNAYKIASKLNWLITNPEKIVEISLNAREFVEREHHYVKIAKSYVNFWKRK